MHHLIDIHYTSKRIILWSQKESVTEIGLRVPLFYRILHIILTQLSSTLLNIVCVTDYIPENQ